jgi:small subunit ribosomal protein S7
MRKTKAKKRPLAPDPRYGDPMVTQFVNNLMLQGKKSTAYGIFYGAMDLIDGSSSEDNGYETWKKAVQNATPSVEVKSRRIGGSTYQIPIEIRPDRRLSMSMKWLIMFARKRSGRSMAEKLASELTAAAKGEGATVKKKEDVHKMAESNKAFSHFRV